MNVEIAIGGIDNPHIIKFDSQHEGFCRAMPMAKHVISAYLHFTSQRITLLQFLTLGIAHKCLRMPFLIKIDLVLVAKLELMEE